MMQGGRDQSVHVAREGYMRQRDAAFGIGKSPEPFASVAIKGGMPRAMHEAVLDQP